MNSGMANGRRRYSVVPLAMLLLLAAFPGGNVRPNAVAETANTGLRTPAGPAFAEGEILVKLKDIHLSSTAYSSASFADIDIIDEFRTLSERTGKTYLHIRSSRLSTETLLARFGQDPDVEAVSPNYRRRIFSTVPNDPKWGKLWGLQKIGAAEAWSVTTGSADIVVGVIDTGVDYNHEDLRGNIWTNVNEIPGNGIDDDGNGYVDDVHGYDFASDNKGGNDSDPMDIDNHGTHVAGTIAAVGNNGIGVTGVSWTARIMALKAARPDGYIYDSDSTEAIEYAVMMKSKYHVNIVALNASFGGDEADAVLEDAIADAANENIIIVAAAGNGGDDDAGDDNDQKPQYPANYASPNVISVAATDPEDNLAGFSNFGARTVDLAAPGVAILSTVRQDSGQEASVTAGPTEMDAYPISYAGLTSHGGLTAYAFPCGKGLSSSDFPPQVNKNIALIERGDNTFRDKVYNAQNAGAVGVIIYNNQPDNFLGTLSEAGNWIPAVSVSQENGRSLIAKGTPQVILFNVLSNYDSFEGTSMAVPHVTGAIALMAAQNPEENYLQRIGRIYAGVDPVPALQGKVATGGRLNLVRTLDLRLGIALTVSRIVGKGWILARDAGLIAFSMQKSVLNQVTGGSFVIDRKEPGGIFSGIKTVTVGELTDGAYTFYDKYLEKGKAYTYRVRVHNAQGTDVGASSEWTL